MGHANHDWPEVHGHCVGCLIEKLEDEQAQKERILGLLRDTKMQHGTCQPRSRKACTACNAQEELDKITKDWKGPTMVLS
jgi:hypothetical protein